MTINLWRPDCQTFTSKAASIAQAALLIIAIYLQLQHPYKPAVTFNAFTNTNDIKPGTNIGIFTSSDGKAIIFNKTIPDWLTEESMMHDIGSTGAIQKIVLTGETTDWVVQDPDKPFLLPFSPPPEG